MTKNTMNQLKVLIVFLHRVHLRLLSYKSSKKYAKKQQIPVKKSNRINTKTTFGPTDVSV